MLNEWAKRNLRVPESSAEPSKNAATAHVALNPWNSPSAANAILSVLLLLALLIWSCAPEIQPHAAFNFDILRWVVRRSSFRIVHSRSFIEVLRLPDNFKSQSVTAPSAQNAKRDELLLLINSLNPIITVETTEEERLEGLLRSIAVQLVVPLYRWSVTTGLCKLTGAPLYGTDQPEQALANIARIEDDAIFLLRDFARYCDNDRISRRLGDLADKFRTARRSIVIAAASIELPPELKGDSIPFNLGLPDATELALCVNQVLTETSRDRRVLMTLDAPAIAQLAQNLVGLTRDEAARTLRRCLLARGEADAALLDAVLDARRAALQADGVLEPIRRDTTFTDVAGLKRLREWVDKRRSALTPEGQRFGLVPPKGVLITGVQGCGKSMAARAIAGEWGIELVRLDAGALYDKYVGESEKRLHKALELAQKLAPVVMWIDEIEKAFASAGSSGEADAGLIPASASHSSHLDARPSEQRLPRCDFQQYFQSAARDAPQGPLR